MSRFQPAGRAGFVFALIVCSAAHAQEAPAAGAAKRVLPADTEIHLRMLEPVASNTHKHGDRFRLEVAEPVIVDGEVLIPAGAGVVGEVIHAAKAGFGGKGGELILTSRFLRVGEQEVKLRSFSAGNGSQRINLAMGLSFVLVGVFVQGNNIAVPAGADVFAKLAADSELPVISSVSTEPTTEIDNNEETQH